MRGAAGLLGLASVVGCLAAGVEAAHAAVDGVCPGSERGGKGARAICGGRQKLGSAVGGSTGGCGHLCAPKPTRYSLRRSGAVAAEACPCSKRDKVFSSLDWLLHAKNRLSGSGDRWAIKYSRKRWRHLLASRGNLEYYPNQARCSDRTSASGANAALRSPAPYLIVRRKT